MSTRSLTQRIVRVNAGTDKGADIAEVATDGGAHRFAGGSGTLVTGTAVVATGLTAVTAFVAVPLATGATATGATEVESIRIQSVTTGAVTVVGIYHSATASIALESASGTSTFRWLAVGT